LDEAPSKRARLGEAAARQQQSDGEGAREHQVAAHVRRGGAAPKLLASARLGERPAHSSGSDASAPSRPSLAGARPLEVWRIACGCCCMPSQLMGLRKGHLPWQGLTSCVGCAGWLEVCTQRQTINRGVEASCICTTEVQGRAAQGVALLPGWTRFSKPLQLDKVQQAFAADVLDQHLP
jgi:hypothetical protein